VIISPVFVEFTVMGLWSCVFQKVFAIDVCRKMKSIKLYIDCCNIQWKKKVRI